MVRSMVPVLIVKSVAENSLMQFEKASDLDVAHMQGASHTSRLLQSGRAMEDQWKGLLQQIVDSGSWTDPKTGKPWVPNKADILLPVQTAIDNMETELDGQKGMNDDIMRDHAKHIEKCNNDLESDLSGIASTELSESRSKEGAHADCRSAEDTAISGMETKCEVFDGLSKQSCAKEQDWYAGYAEGDEGAGSLKEVVVAAQNCKGAVATTSAKAAECDGKQDEFKAAWCSYKTALDDTCTRYDDCYALSTGNYDQAKESITKLETEQKTIFRMLGRIRCYLNLLFQKANDGKDYVPTQSDITTCEDTPITNDDKLDVDFKSKAAEQKCKDDSRVKDEPVENAPGSSDWFTAKFAGMTNHEKLNDNAVC